jgi:hypothetical protein
MLAILFIILVMIAIYLGFCIQSNEYTIQGRFKLKVIELLNNIANYLPDEIRSRLYYIIDYCLYRRNPIIQVYFAYLDCLYDINASCFWYICHVWC